MSSNFNNAPILGLTSISNILLYLSMDQPISPLLLYVFPNISNMLPSYEYYNHIISNSMTHISSLLLPSIVIPIGYPILNTLDLLLLILLYIKIRPIEYMTGSSIMFYLLSIPTITSILIMKALYTLISLSNTCIVDYINKIIPLFLCNHPFIHLTPALGAILYFIAYYTPSDLSYPGNNTLNNLARKMFTATDNISVIYIRLLIVIIIRIATYSLTFNTDYSYYSHATIILFNFICTQLLMYIGYKIAPLILKYRCSYLFRILNILIKLLKKNTQFIFGPIYNCRHFINKSYLIRKMDQSLYNQDINNQPPVRDHDVNIQSILDLQLPGVTETMARDMLRTTNGDVETAVTNLLQYME